MLKVGNKEHVQLRCSVYLANFEDIENINQVLHQANNHLLVQS